MIRFESSSHWYHCKGGEPEPKHDADLRVARKLGLYPSPTSIDKDIFKNDFLERWKMNELVIAASQNMILHGETPEDYANRIYDLSLTKSRDASEFGKDLHDTIDGYPQMPMNPDMLPWFDQFGHFYEKNFVDKVSSESIIVDHDLSVAGRGDFIGIHKVHGLVMADWKTQGVKADSRTGRKKAKFYDSWPRQLAFYSRAYAKSKGILEPITCMSVVIDSTEASEPYVKVWTPEEIQSAYEDFCIATYQWFKKRDYWPNGPKTLSELVGLSSVIA